MAVAGDPRPWGDLRTTGLLWLINTSLLHPRGFALALHVDDAGEFVGWSIMGDGSERWVFAEDGWPEGEDLEHAFAAVSRLLAVRRDGEAA